MKYRIERKDTIRLVGSKFFVYTENGLNYTDVPSLWDNFPKERFDELMRLSDGELTGVLGIFGEKHDGGFDYWIAAATNKPCPDHFDIVEIPAAKWLVFEAKGALPAAIQDVFKRLYTEWFPANPGFARRWEVYEMEWFSDGDKSSDSYECEGWVPVVE